MKAKEAAALYEENWDLEFTTMEVLYQRIKVLAENGCAELCVYLDSKRKYDEVYSILRQDGYRLEDYNGGNSNIIQVNWGSC